MKKLALLLLGILLGFLLCYFFFCKDTSVDYVEGMPPAPKGKIDPVQITQLDRDYDPRHKLISDSLFSDGKKDNRSSWYSLDELNTFLKYAEAQATELEYTFDGVRIYLGAKKPKKGEKEGMTTMFFVPTGTQINTQKGSMFNLNFNIWQLGSSDIPGADGLDFGQHGDPPSANYPQ